MTFAHSTTAAVLKVGAVVVQRGKGNVMIALLAYLDPGAGSMVLQAAVAGSAGLLVLVRYAATELWRRWGVTRGGH